MTVLRHFAAAASGLPRRSKCMIRAQILEPVPPRKRQGGVPRLHLGAGILPHARIETFGIPAATFSQRLPPD
jgi:hypothetical protein